MRRNRVVAIPLLIVLLALLPFLSFPVPSYDSLSNDIIGPDNKSHLFYTSDLKTGTLNPVLIQHTGTSSGMTTSDSARTDVDRYPSAEVYLPAGAPIDYFSGEGTGGYYLVGSSGSGDFGSVAGSISFWIKWDLTAPHGRFWGQHANFETRWTSNRLVLDWGSDTTAQGTKSDWLVDHWYFIAISWNETSNYLAIFWGDETTVPVEDYVTYGWTVSVVGLHTENNILNSIARVGEQVDGHIDDFRYYTSDRNLSDIQSDYLPVGIISDPTLSAHYQFENDLTDSVGDLDLQVSGATTISRDVPRSLRGWFGDQIKVTANDLRKLYVLNGTFDTGNPGTNEDWPEGTDGTYYADGWLARREVDSFLGRQRASYVEDFDSYVLLENEAYYIGSDFRHYNATEIYWYQDVENSALNNLFYFSMDYNYMRGPIGTSFSGIFDFRFEILNGSEIIWSWSIDPTNITQRQNWYSTGQVLVNMTDSPSSFSARVMLSVITPSTYIAIDETHPDLDGDATNGQFLTFYINNVELKSYEPLTGPQVDLQISSPETGLCSFSNAGVALLNHSVWEESVVPLVFSSNTTISYDFSAEFSKMFRYYNSSATTNLNNLGASYSIDFGQSANITFFTYVQSSPGVKDLGFVIFCPTDWENATVEDPFGSLVYVEENENVEVPSGYVNSVGWWKIEISAPNYAHSVYTEMYNGVDEWEESSTFFILDQIRCTVVIGSDTSLVASIDDLSISWYTPSSSLWASEIKGNATGSNVVSSEMTVGSSNTSAGAWHLEVSWTNGTEIALGLSNFQIHHQLNIIAATPHIDTQVDEIFTAAIYLYDQDSGTPILSNADVRGNWSAGDVQFSPNLAKGWWEADVNASLTGTGIYTMTVNATLAYHSMSSYTITIEITTVTIMTILGEQIIELEPDELYAVKLRFMFLDGLGIEDADVSVLSYSGPENGLSYGSGLSVIGQPGNYSIEFSGNISGTYFVTLTASKNGVSTAATSFYVVIGAVSADVDISGPSPPDVFYFNQTYTVTLFYHTNDIPGGIDGAVLDVTYNPVSVVEWVETTDGYYNVSIRVPEIGSYSVYLRFSKFGYDFAEISFTFDVIEVPTVITYFGQRTTYYESRTYEFALYYNSTLENGVVDADIVPIGPIRDFFETTVLGDGWYNFSLTPTLGNWNVTIWLTKTGYAEQVLRFEMDVDMIPILLSSMHPLNSTYTRYSESILTLRVLPLAGDNFEKIPSALIRYTLTDANDPDSTVVIIGYFSEFANYYEAKITVPSVGLYELRITIAKDHHESFVQVIVLNSESSPSSVFVSYLSAGLIGALSLFAIVGSIFLGQRWYSDMTSKRSLELLGMKNRLDDVRNLLGLLVIQRNVGLSIYSKILKGGFEEALLSSFISAISQFREEFSMDEAKWTAIPLTEVIMALQTEAFICAIITVDSASIHQREQLESFGLEIGGFFDHDEEATKQSLQTPKRIEFYQEKFEPIFEKHFDINLMKRYVGAKKTLPDHLKPVSDAIKKSALDRGVTPESMIKSVLEAGVGEYHAYSLVFEAIDGDYLIPSEHRLPFPIDTFES